MMGKRQDTQHSAEKKSGGYPAAVRAEENAGFIGDLLQW